jgi:hypothetical protein
MFQELVSSKGVCCGYYSFDHLNSVASGFTSGLAVQPPVGLLGKRPAGASPVGCDHWPATGLVLGNSSTEILRNLELDLGPCSQFDSRE